MTCKCFFADKAVGQPAEINLWINGKSNVLKVNQTEWTELKLNPQVFRKDENEIKFEVKNGSIDPRLDQYLLISQIP